MQISSELQEMKTPPNIFEDRTGSYHALYCKMFHARFSI
nr:MAG TPA: hypothetical protein [Caudoviricetes sp.]